MDLLKKIDIILNDMTVAADVETNTAKGSIDIIGGKCPEGYVYDSKKKVCVPKKNESSSIEKKKFFELGRKVNDTLVKMHVLTMKPKDSDFNKAAKKLNITKKEAIRSWNFFTWGDESLLPETSIVGGSYISGTTVNIIGSQQTRTGYTTKRQISDLARKQNIDKKMDDPGRENILGRKGLKFNKETGAFEPELWSEL